VSSVLKGATVVAALWAVPLVSVPSRSDRIARVCEGTVDTVNVGSHVPTCPFLILLCVRGTDYHTRQAPPIRARIGLVYQSRRSQS
jgi:hypothetical protein